MKSLFRWLIITGKFDKVTTKVKGITAGAVIPFIYLVEMMGLRFTKGIIGISKTYLCI